MSSSTFAACVDPGSFSDEEAKTGPQSAVLESGFWSGSARRMQPKAAELGRPARRAKPEAEPKVVRKAAVVSPAMRHVFELVQPLARSDVSMTLMGETGTGKDVLARIIHQNSPRKDGPFVVFDCGAVAQNLAESELLGHERGSFTGAMAAHEGAFERADGGTLFLDEIGELPLDLQTRLLRVLGNRSVRRVGGTVDRPVDVRIVAATNRDLQSEVTAGRFRQDLYFRLAAAVVQVPSLRDRREDLPTLVARLLDDLGHRETEVTPSALAMLASRPWPGNVRELKNALACAVAFLDGQVLEARHFALPAVTEKPASLEALPLGGVKLETIEWIAIQQTLRQTRGNKARTAQLLGIATSTLYEKIKKHQRSAEAVGTPEALQG
jgi:DNA-binding NtrC family response regulator